MQVGAQPESGEEVGIGILWLGGPEEVVAVVLRALPDLSAQAQPHALVPIERDELQTVPEVIRRPQIHAFQYRPVLVEPADLIGGALQLVRPLICLGPPRRRRMDEGQRLERKTDDDPDASRPGAHGVSPPTERLSSVALWTLSSAIRRRHLSDSCGNVLPKLRSVKPPTSLRILAESSISAPRLGP